MEFIYKRIVALICLCVFVSMLSIITASAADMTAVDKIEMTEQTDAPLMGIQDYTEPLETEVPAVTVMPDSEEPERISVADIVVADYDDVLEVGSTLKLTTTVLPNTATDQTVSYSSSDTAIATVSQTGEVKGVSAGEVTITVSCGGIEKRIVLTVKASAKLTVKVSAKMIEVNQDYILLKPGTTFQLQATISPQNATDKTLEYSSGDPAVATVSNKGLITAKSYGSTNIIIKNKDTFTSVLVIVNGNALPEVDIPENDPAISEYAVEEHMAISACPIVDSDMLQYLYTHKKDLYIEAADFALKIHGELITNFNNEVKTDIGLKTEQGSISFTLNEGMGLCGTVSVCIYGADEYKYLYLLNEITGKYDLVKKDGLSEIDVTTPGQYLLTKQLMSNVSVYWRWIGLSGLVIVILLVVYICLKKRYWFW